MNQELRVGWGVLLKHGLAMSGGSAVFITYHRVKAVTFAEELREQGCKSAKVVAVSAYLTACPTMKSLKANRLHVWDN